MPVGSEVAMKVTVAQLRLLLAVLRAGSIGTAARRLGMTQSGASQAIIALERALGAKLLTRGRDGVAPTAFALAIQEDAEIVGEAVGRILDRARGAGLGGALRVASVPSVARRLLPAWSRQFRRLYPDVELSIFEGHHIEIGEWVSEGVAEIGLTAVVPRGLDAERLREDDMIVVAPRGHAVLRGARTGIEDLIGGPLIAAGLGCGPVLADLFAAAGQPTPRMISAQDVATALTMVRQGVGLTILPEIAVPTQGMADLRARPLWPAARRRMYLVTRPDGTAAAPVSRFLTLVRESAGHQPH
jgi:DNA-binding transcriptional LysR family regulator